MVAAEGRWNWDHLQDLFPEEVLERKATVSTPMSHYENDVSGWRWSEKREFSVGSTYMALMEIERGSFLAILVNLEDVTQFYALLFEEWLHDNIHGVCD
ncbi:hypothetical protein V6N11_031587 [Hibiscus sabdariffa]|uniref:Uncharacterized protein n=1 Tax=Hibiscus sabdariffa TaxID=183260 RepID=A0ABR2SYR0_9ROSI